MEGLSVPCYSQEDATANKHYVPPTGLVGEVFAIIYVYSRFT